MRLFAVFVAICALSQTAAAQSQECKSMPDPGTRLACYDRAAPPAAPAEKSGSAATPADKAAPPRSAVKTSKIDSSKYVDTIGAEDKLMDAKLKNICRGC
jgi:hypothetical protein